MPRGIALLNRLQHLLLVNIDEHPARHGIPDAGVLNLARLEHHITVGEDYGLAHGLQMRQHLQRLGIETLGEWIVDQEAGHAQQPLLIQVLEPILLQGAQIIDVPEPGADLFQDL